MYNAEFAKLWLINSHNGIKEKGIKPININNYPSIKKHLNKYQPRLAKRLDKGLTPYNLRNCTYMEDFFRPKIIYPEITKYLNFYYDNHGFYTNNKCFIITGKKIEFLVSFLNSRLFKYCYRDSFPELQGGTRELRKVFIEYISVPEITNQQNKMFKNTLERITISNEIKEDPKGLIAEVDEMIFNICNLTEQERETIKNFTIS